MIPRPRDARSPRARAASRSRSGRPAISSGVIAIHHAAPTATLRLDANRAWSRALTRPLLHALADLPIEFVEEPCPDAHELLADALPCRSPSTRAWPC